jgi:hypothetical protein
MKGNDVIRWETETQTKEGLKRERVKCKLNEWNCFFQLESVEDRRKRRATNICIREVQMD